MENPNVCLTLARGNPALMLNNDIPLIASLKFLIVRTIDLLNHSI